MCRRNDPREKSWEAGYRRRTGGVSVDRIGYLPYEKGMGEGVVRRRDEVMATGQEGEQ